MLNRNYTDLHPEESCTGCKFNIKKEARCTYRSKVYWCYRDEINDKQEILFEI